MVSLEDYAGREQAYVKHVFLERYLEALIFKTASTYNHIVYIDGFAGPWQSADEQFEDTSFGIALSALRKAKAAWKRASREVKMTAMGLCLSTSALGTTGETATFTISILRSSLVSIATTREAFLAHVVMPDGQTYQHTAPRISPRAAKCSRCCRRRRARNRPGGKRARQRAAWRV